MKIVALFALLSVAVQLVNCHDLKLALSISPGYYHTCALERRQGVEVGGALRCWGQDSQGQSSPPPGIFKQVSSGDLFSCAIGIDSKVKCWGKIRGTPDHRGFTQVSSGKAHACGLTANGKIECWGKNDHGESKAPDHLYSQVNCGHTNTCGLRLDGSVECWGKVYGKEMSPTTSKFTQIDVGMKQRACGITVGGDVKCWESSKTNNECELKEGKYRYGVWGLGFGLGLLY